MMSLLQLKHSMKKLKTLRERISQIFFVIRHTMNLVKETNRGLVIGVLVLGVISGFAIVTILYLDRLIIDTLVSSIGTAEVRSTVTTIGTFILIRLLISVFVQITNLINRYMSRALSWQLNMQIELLMALKNSALDLATLEDDKFRDKYTKIERESGNRAFSLLMPLTEIPSRLAGFLSTIAILFVFSPVIALCIVIFSVPQLMVDSHFIKKWYEFSEKSAPLYRLRGWLEYYLVRNNNFMELKLLNLPKYLTLRMKEIQDERGGGDCDKPRFDHTR